MMRIGPYRVIFRDSSAWPWDSYIAQGGSGGKTRLYRLSGGGYLAALIPFLARSGGQSSVFSHGGGTYLAFDYPEGRRLDQAAPAEVCGLARVVLDAIIMSGMPREYLSVITPGRVVIKPDGEIGFDMLPPDVAVPAGQDAVFKAVAGIMEAVWPSPPDADGRRWLDGLKSGAFENLCAARAAMPAPQAASLPAPVPVPSPLDRLRERLPAIAGTGAAVAAALLVAWSLLTMPRQAPPPGQIYRLGDMIITNSRE